MTANDLYYKTRQTLSPSQLAESGLSFYDALMALPVRQQMAFRVLEMDNVVLELGYAEYFRTEIGQCAYETVEDLRRIGSVAKADALAHALALVNRENDPPEAFRQKLATKQYAHLYSGFDLNGPFWDLGSVYFDSTLRENLVVQLEMFFQGEEG